ncbi:MipA/OmpV family protein [Massilia glaciei]|uniref:MipA/OmpV family protein n=2 Tax=Massilia glaciei TaxID=1524097 RepID=A0A2U2HFY1_9BURK|nr:MipA/OmpV family protein [Massilia glaciei]
MPAAWAQQSREAPPPRSMGGNQAGGSQWGLGIGIFAERQPYREHNNKLRALPLIMYMNKYVSVLGPGIDVHLPSAGPVALRLRARYSSDGYEAKDSPFLAGMAERKDSVWLGGAALWRAGFANLSAEILTNPFGNSDGTKFKLQLDRRFMSGAFAFTPRVAAQRLDDNYVDYYYGVRQTEARIDRARYAGRAATNLEVGVRVDYAIAQKQSVFVDLSTTRLGGAIERSPLVDRSSAGVARAGYLYQF